MAAWQQHQFTIGMPHMVPGKLSEVELLKWLGAYHWEHISHALGVPSQELHNRDGRRLYASFVNLELTLGQDGGLESFTEGSPVWVRNRVGFYAGKFVEGLSAFGLGHDATGSAEQLDSFQQALDQGSPAAYMTTAFIVPGPDNKHLLVYRPVAADAARPPQLARRPRGIEEHEQVKATGRLPELEQPGEYQALALRDSTPVRYPITPESDLNGAGLVYFARYVAMMNYGERQLLTGRLRDPLPAELVGSLSTERRRVHFFANAGPADSVELRITARCLPLPGAAPPTLAPGHRQLAKMLLWIEITRASDGVLMARSVVRKSLNVPAEDPQALRAGQAFIRQLTARS